MKKSIIFVLIFISLIAAGPAFAKITDNSLIATLYKLVQKIMPGEFESAQSEITPAQQMGEPEEEFVDPRQIQQALREIKDIKKELGRFAKQFSKLPGATEDLNQLNSLLGQVNEFETKIAAGQDVQDTIRDFHDAQIWDEVQKFRAKIEIPKEMKQWNREVKRAEKLLGQKRTQESASGFGVDLGKAKARLDEIKAGLARVQSFYGGGNLEDAMEEFDEMRRDFHPGEIVGVLQRLQELVPGFKKIKNQEIKDRIKQVLGEIVNSFNEEEYRAANELMNEAFNDLMKLISQAYYIGKKNGPTKESWIQALERLEIKITEGEDRMMQFKEYKAGPNDASGQSQNQPWQQQPKPAQSMQRPAQPLQPQGQQQPLQPQPLQPQSQPMPSNSGQPIQSGSSQLAPIVPAPSQDSIFNSLPQPLPAAQ